MGFSARREIEEEIRDYSLVTDDERNCITLIVHIMIRRYFPFSFGLFLMLFVQAVQAQTYTFYVAAESEDKVYQVSFDGETYQSTIENVTTVGMFPTEIEGPHGIGIDPSGDYWYVSLGHGIPFGFLYKYETGSDRLAGKVELGMFPATLDISPVTGWIYVINFNLHGPHEPSSLSVVDGDTMDEIERIETGIMPHGSRLTSDGTRQYHVSMMTNEIYEIDGLNLDVSRVLNLDSGQKKDHSVMAHGNRGEKEEEKDQTAVKPTWASPHPQQPFVYVAGNGNNIIYVINTKKWEVDEVWESPGKGPYNLEPTNNGRQLVVTYKGEGATGIWDIEKGEQLAKISNSRKVTHGVAISPDDRFAFISAEGIGGESGVVDIIDLDSLKIADVIEIGKQAAGITFWKMEQK